MKSSIIFFLLVVNFLIPSIESIDYVECHPPIRILPKFPRTNEGPTWAVYNGTFTCDQPRFCAMTYYMEEDSLSADDDFTYVPLDCSDTKELFHVTKFNMTGANNIDHVYNPILIVYHDCGGKLVEEKVVLRDIFANNERFFCAYTYKLRKSGPIEEEKTMIKENSASIFRADMFKNKEYKESVISWIANKSVFFQYETVQVHYDGTLTCNTGKRFCAMIYYIEEDMLVDDDLAFIILQCTEGPKLHHQIIVNVTGGDGDDDDFEYEPFIQVFHDCGGVIRCGYLRLPNVPMSKTPTAVAYTQNISNYGSEAENSFATGTRAKILDRYHGLKGDIKDWFLKEKSFQKQVHKLITNGTMTVNHYDEIWKTKYFLKIEGVVLTRYNVSLTCYEPPFCAMMYFVEHDKWSADEDFAYVPLNCSDTTELRQTIAFNMTGGDGFNDPAYDPILTVYHDCGGRLLEEKIMLMEVPTTNAQDTYEYMHQLRNSSMEEEEKLIIESATVFRDKMFKNQKYKQKVIDWITNKSAYVDTIQVHYDGTLTCNTGKKFCAKIYYREWDFFKNDHLAFLRKNCTKGRELRHQITVNMTGGDGSQDIAYEPLIEVFHDCGGLFKFCKYELPAVSMGKTPISFAYTRNITNKGEKIQGGFY